MKKRKLTEPTIPAHVKADSIAAAEWRRLVDSMKRAETLSEDDAAMIEAACLAYSEHRRVSAEVARTGATYSTPGGRIFPNPGASIAADAWRRWHGALQSLGLSPTSRKRAIASKATRDDSAVENFLKTDSAVDPRDFLRTENGPRSAGRKTR